MLVITKAELRRSRVEERKQKHSKNIFRNANVTDFLVIVVLTSIILFTITVLYFYYTEGTPPPDSFMQYFFGFFGLELLSMAGIQVSSNMRRRKDD